MALHPIFAEIVNSHLAVTKAVARVADTTPCERCNGRGVIETGTMSQGPGGLGFDTVPCGCEERQAFRDAAEEAGWLVELETFDPDEGPLPTVWAMPDSFTLGPPICRDQVPAGAVYEHSNAIGKLWINDEPHLMTADDSSFATTFRVATLKPHTQPKGRSDGHRG